jgi:lysophospholipase L1-like esterase
VTLSAAARRRLLGGSVALVLALAVPYAVPSLHWMEIWKADETYVPFWNVLGRGSESVAPVPQIDPQLREFQRLAQDDELLAKSEAGEPGDRLLDERAEAAHKAPKPGARPAPQAPGKGLSRALQEEPVLRVEDLPDANNADGASGGRPGQAAPETVLPVPAAPSLPAERPEVARGQAGPGRKTYPAYVPRPEDEEPVLQPIENMPALDHYFARLTLTDLGTPGAITRAGQWGDSVLGGDGLTHSLRRHLQARFGDAGHGYHNLGKYGIGYYHQGVRFNERSAWRSCEIIFKCRADRHYGYGGATSDSRGGAISRFATAPSGPGSRVSRFELWYLQQPGGGRLEVKADGEIVASVDSNATTLRDAVEVVRVEDGPHEFEVRALPGGLSRGYGVVMERDVPGVVWDELSLIGSFTQRLDYQDADHLSWQLQRRSLDLMVFMFGGNDVQRQESDLKHTMEPYEREYAAVISKFRSGLPRSSCMVMSLIDHAERQGTAIETREIVPRLVAAQRRVALAQGCAFFDTFTAMGGPGSIGRWYSARPQLAAGDLSHPTSRGQGVIAALVYRALMQGYADFRKAHAGEKLASVEKPPSVGAGRSITAVTAPPSVPAPAAAP